MPCVGACAIICSEMESDRDLVSRGRPWPQLIRYGIDDKTSSTEGQRTVAVYQGLDQGQARVEDF